MTIETVPIAAAPRVSASGERPHGPGRIGPVALGLALGSALATFLVLAGFTPIEPTHDVVVGTLCINLAFALILLGIIVWEVSAVRRVRRQEKTGSQLHSRVVGLFSIIAVAPALLLAAIAAITLDRGLDEWFSTRLRTIVDNAAVVAKAYLQEQVVSMRGDVLAMASDLNRARPAYESDRARFREFLNAQAAMRGMGAAMLLNADYAIVEQANLQPAIHVPPPPPGTLEASGVEPGVLTPGSQNLIGAVYKLSAFDDLWLFVARPVDPKAAQYLRMTEEAASDYSMLAQRRFGVQVAFGLMYVVIALTLLLAAIWLGLAFANRLVAPILRLIGAANQVTLGNLYVQVPVGRRDGDLGGLPETFNRMTSQLRTQRNELVEASEQIDHRRRFMEAVLSGVSAGVLGLDADGSLTLVNRAAEQILHATTGDLLGKPVVAVCSGARRPGGRGPRRDGTAGACDRGHQPIRPRAHPQRARHQRTVDLGGARLRGHARRHHRPRGGAAHVGLGRRRTADRPRDQESAHSDPAFGRTHPA